MESRAIDAQAVKTLLAHLAIAEDSPRGAEAIKAAPIANYVLETRPERISGDQNKALLAMEALLRDAAKSQEGDLMQCFIGTAAAAQAAEKAVTDTIALADGIKDYLGGVTVKPDSAIQKT